MVHIYLQQLLFSWASRGGVTETAAVTIRTTTVTVATAVATYCGLLLLLLLLLLCDSGREATTIINDIHDGCSSRAGPGIVYTVILVYATGDSGYPNRGAAGQPPSLFLQSSLPPPSFRRCCWSRCWGWCSLSSIAREVRGRLALREGVYDRVVVV